MAGKGSRRRPGNEEKIRKNWDNINWTKKEEQKVIYYQDLIDTNTCIKCHDHGWLWRHELEYDRVTGE